MNVKEVLIRTLWKVFGTLPLERNAVLFSSFDGRGYSDSPKAIAQALLDSGADVKLYWLVKSQKEAESLPAKIVPVDRNDKLAMIRAYATSRVWVNNCRQFARNKRKGQFYLQTWHGFALKMIEKDAEQALPEEYLHMCRHDGSTTDLMVSGSTFMSDLYRRSFWFDGKVAAFGTPRNDIFFQDNAHLQKKIRDILALPDNRKLILYAPTFRADHSLDAYALDTERLLHSCQQRFGGDWTVLVRLHPGIADKSAGLFPYDGLNIVDATAYPDMQELLAGIDLLITDYSSSMFDYALSGKPCIQFALDIDEYKKDRNFYFPIQNLPFPLAQSNDELQALILSYDADQWTEQWEAFKRHNGFCEDGRASQRCAEWILSKLQT